MKKSLLEVAHDIAVDLHEVGGIDVHTMRDFEITCLPSVKSYTPRQIKRIRLYNKVSQAVFAAYLNISLSTVRQWEQGLKKPSGTSLKVLNLVDRYGVGLLAAG